MRSGAPLEPHFDDTLPFTEPLGTNSEQLLLPKNSLVQFKTICNDLCLRVFVFGRQSLRGSVIAIAARASDEPLNPGQHVPNNVPGESIPCIATP
jgi:hypothetical protein